MGAPLVRVTRSLISASFHCSRWSCHTPSPSIKRTAGMVKTVGQKVGRKERFMASPSRQESAEPSPALRNGRGMTRLVPGLAGAVLVLERDQQGLGRAQQAQRGD